MEKERSKQTKDYFMEIRKKKKDVRIRKKRKEYNESKAIEEKRKERKE